MFAKDFPRRPMRSLIAVERDLLWQPALALERPPEKRFGGCNIPLGAEQKIHRLSLLVDSTIKRFCRKFSLWARKARDDELVYPASE
jgi:hypothetical protein